jgi:hypothetical protein
MVFPVKPHYRACFVVGYKHVHWWVWICAGTKIDIGEFGYWIPRYVSFT